MIIAGDIAGYSHREVEYLNSLKGEVYAVGGNHLGYDYYRVRVANASLGINEPLMETKQDCIAYIQSHVNDNIHYLNDEWIKVGDKILFGGTMYSNFELYGKKNKDTCKWTAERWLNDFRNVYTYHPKRKTVEPVTPDDYIRWFNRFMKKLKKCLSETTEDVIVISHFAPSVKSIEAKYLNKPNRIHDPGSELNAVYASNLEDFIKENPRIKLFVHGHVHGQFDYMIGQCRVVCEPYGYSFESEIPPEVYEGKIVEV